MIRVNMMLVPHGIEDLKKKIYEIRMINNRTGDSELGNYEIQFYYKGGKDTIQIKKHKRSKGALQLLNEALTEYLIKLDKNLEE